MIDTIDENGTVPVPEGPGPGVEYDWEFIEDNATVAFTSTSDPGDELPRGVFRSEPYGIVSRGHRRHWRHRRDGYPRDARGRRTRSEEGRGEPRGGHDAADGIELVAVADVDEEKLRRFGDVWEIP